MFGKNQRALQIKMVKTNDVTDADPQPPLFADPEAMKTIANDFVKETAKVVAKTAVIIFAVNLAATIVVKTVEKALEN